MTTDDTVGIAFAAVLALMFLVFLMGLLRDDPRGKRAVALVLSLLLCLSAWLLGREMAFQEIAAALRHLTP